MVIGDEMGDEIEDVASLGKLGQPASGSENHGLTCAACNHVSMSGRWWSLPVSDDLSHMPTVYRHGRHWTIALNQR